MQLMNAGTACRGTNGHVTWSVSKEGWIACSGGGYEEEEDEDEDEDDEWGETDVAEEEEEDEAGVEEDVEG
jgi:hypothetical protein